MTPENQASPALRVMNDRIDSLALPEELVKEQLDRIKASTPFRSSKRCVLFLDYVVQAVLNSHTEFLKERTLGVEVFGRAPNYDTNQDPVVRGTASEVRKRLAQYYQLPGNQHRLRIDLPPGSYAPEFHSVPAEILAEPLVPLAPAPLASVPIKRLHSNKTLFFVLAPSLLVMALTIALTFRSMRAENVIDQFWTPILSSPGPVLICVGQPVVYNLLGNLSSEVENRVTRRMDRRLPAMNPEDSINAPLKDFAPNSDRYLCLGDAMCLSDLTAFFARKNRGYHVRGGGSASFADLREAPTVLIGAFTNDWNMRLMGELRFSFHETTNRTSQFVFDRQHPLRRDWQLTNVWPDWKMPQDYAIISRILYASTGKAVVTAAGITQYGTAAAGEFLANPDYLRQALRNAPADWSRRNMQIVLVTKVIEGTPGPPQVIATYFW